MAKICAWARNIVMYPNVLFVVWASFFMLVSKPVSALVEGDRFKFTDLKGDTVIFTKDKYEYDHFPAHTRAFPNKIYYQFYTGESLKKNNFKTKYLYTGSVVGREAVVDDVQYVDDKAIVLSLSVDGERLALHVPIKVSKYTLDMEYVVNSFAYFLAGDVRKLQSLVGKNVYRLDGGSDAYRIKSAEFNSNQEYISVDFYNYGRNLYLHDQHDLSDFLKDYISEDEVKRAYALHKDTTGLAKLREDMVGKEFYKRKENGGDYFFVRSIQFRRNDTGSDVARNEVYKQFDYMVYTRSKNEGSGYSDFSIWSDLSNIVPAAVQRQKEAEEKAAKKAAEEKAKATRKAELTRKYGASNAQLIIDGEVEIGFTIEMCEEALEGIKAMVRPKRTKIGNTVYETWTVWFMGASRTLKFKNGILVSDDLDTTFLGFPLF